MPAPPYFAGTHTPSKPERGHLRQQLAIEPVLAIELLNLRRHFPRRPLARGLLEQPMIVVEIEIHQQKSSTSSAMSQRRDAKTPRSRFLKRILCDFAPLR